MSSWQSTSVKISFNDFTSICRICFARNNLRNLQEFEYLIDVLQNLTNRKVEDNDGLPQKICTKCIKKLEDISDFIDLAKYNNLCLRRVYLTKSDLEANTVTWVSNVSEIGVQVDTDEKKSNKNNNYERSDHQNKLDKQEKEKYIVHKPQSNGNKECVNKNVQSNKYIHKIFKRSETRSGGQDYIKRRRELNRQAAAKCRKKMNDKLKNLAETVENLENANLFLKNRKQAYEKEIKDLFKTIAKFKCSSKHGNLTLKKMASEIE